MAEVPLAWLKAGRRIFLPSRFQLPRIGQMRSIVQISLFFGRRAQLRFLLSFIVLAGLFVAMVAPLARSDAESESDFAARHILVDEH